MRKAAVFSLAVFFACQAASPAAPTMAFVFGEDERGRRIGGKHDTSLLIIRNPRKLRPFFITGKALRGTIRVALREDLEPDMAGIVEAATTTGSFTGNFTRYASSHFDLERRACTDWLRRDPWPEITLKVKALADWVPVQKRKKKKAECYKVNLRGELSVAGRAATLDVPAQVTIQPGKGRQPLLLVVESDFKLNGSVFGLGGDDAGPLNLYLYCQAIGSVESSR